MRAHPIALGNQLFPPAHLHGRQLQASQKRAKDEDKNCPNVKLEDSPSMAEHMPSSSPSVANFDASWGSLTPAIPGAVIVKSETPVLTRPPSCENVPEFTFSANHPQIHHQQRMFRPMISQVQKMMGQNMNDDMPMTWQQDYGFMVEVDGFWDSSYGQS
jgi:hypothetical protein